MKSLLNRVWKEDEGVLTFEWILLITVLVIGIVGGVTAVRDAVITELGDVAQAVMQLDTSYRLSSPWEVVVADCDQDGASGSEYEDGFQFDEGRGGFFTQTPVDLSCVTETPPGASASDPY